VRNKYVGQDVKVTETLEQTLINVVRPVNLMFRKLSNKFYTIYPEEPGPAKQSWARDAIPGDAFMQMRTLTAVANPLTFPSLQMAVSGTITDESGITLPGASVLEKGTTNGTSTDAEGRYALNISDQHAILVVSFIGYNTEE